MNLLVGSGEEIDGMQEHVACIGFTEVTSELCSLQNVFFPRVAVVGDNYLVTWVILWSLHWDLEDEFD